MNEFELTTNYFQTLSMQNLNVVILNSKFHVDVFENRLVQVVKHL